MKFLRPHLGTTIVSRRALTLVTCLLVSTCGIHPATKAADSDLGWQLPSARDVKLGGPLGQAYRQGVARLAEDPYRSVVYLRSDLSFEMERSFTNYSGDISGRFMEIACLTSPPGRLSPPPLPELLKNIGRYQLPDGHFGRDIDWTQPLEPENPRAVILPVFWGHSRLLVGLLEAHRATGNGELLDGARRIGDFYIATADRFLDPDREAEYRSTGTYAAGYVTDYFPGIEGLVRLANVTGENRYLAQAERMAEFFARFDILPLDHSHGNLITHHGLVLLYETTGKMEYLERARQRWEEAWTGGYVWPTGGVGERFRVASSTDEGCSEADWLRLCLDLWRTSGEVRYLEAAERLLLNHYPMNGTANGGFGHHRFVCDDMGPLLMQPEFTEAVWCCTFHGLLGLHTLHSYVVAGSQQGLFINFPCDVTASVQTGTQLCQVSVRQEFESPQSVVCRVRLEPPAGGRTGVPVFLRRPAWAERVSLAVSDAAQPLGADSRGYLRLPESLAEGEEVTIRFAFDPRLENRRRQGVSLDGSHVTRHSGVVLCNGPYVMLASAGEPRPVLLLEVDREGRWRLPAAEDGVYHLPQVSSMEASPEQIRTAWQNGPRVRLSPWHGHPRDQNAVIVCDVITVPLEIVEWH